MTQYARPNSDITTGTWSPSTGLTLFGCIDEVFYDQTDYISTSATNDTCEVALSAVTDPVSATGHTIRVRAKRTSSGASCIGYLMEGTTQRAAFSVGVSSAYGTTTYILSAGEANNITNYANLRLRFVGTKATIACAELAVPDPPTLTAALPSESASVLTAILVTLVSLVTPIQTCSVAEAVSAASAPPLQISVAESVSTVDELPILYETVSVTENTAVYIEAELPPLELTVTEQVAVADVLASLYDSTLTSEVVEVFVNAPGEVMPPLTLEVSDSAEVTEYYPGWRETVAVSEEFSATLETIWLVQVAESLNVITEEVAVTVPEPVTLEIAVGDSCGVAEEVAGYEVYLVDVTDTAGAVDEMAVNVPVPVELNVDVSQAAAVTEVATPMLRELVIDVTQSVAVVDTVAASSIQQNRTINVISSASVLDSAQGTFNITISISESVSVAEAIDVTCLAQPLLITDVAQSVTVTEDVGTPVLITSLAIDVTDDAGITAEAFTLDIAETIPIPALLGTIEDSALAAEVVTVAINPSTYTLVYLMRMS